MQRRRGSSFEISFDGLTDSVTNLVGSLVLVVVLVIAVTRPMASGMDTPPPPENRVGAERPIDRLVEEIRQMRVESESVDRQVQQMNARIPEIAHEIELLHLQVQETTGQP